jgi:predicted nucleic acid-binding protein
MARPFTVYLDSNVLIQICDGRNDELRAVIDSSIVDNKLIYPFSAEQIDELTSSRNSQQSASRLEYLGQISNNIYFCNSVTELGFGTQAPQEVHVTIREVTLSSDTKRALNNLVTHEQRLQARLTLGLSPNVLNNMNGKEAVAAIDVALSKLAPPDQAAPRSLHELMLFSERFMPPAPTGFGEPSRIKTQYEKRNQDVTVLFSLLDSFGYWPDDERAIKRGSGSADARHVVNASFYHVLVSADQKLRGKAEAVYQILGLDTHVLSVEEFMRLEVINDG